MEVSLVGVTVLIPLTGRMFNKSVNGIEEKTLWVASLNPLNGSYV